MKLCFHLSVADPLLCAYFSQGVAFCRGTNGDRILIADSNNQCVQVFEAEKGRCLLKFGTRGRMAGMFQRPTGVAVTPNGNYLIADYDNKWVSMHSPESKYLGRYEGIEIFFFFMFFL